MNSVCVILAFGIEAAVSASEVVVFSFAVNALYACRRFWQAVASAGSVSAIAELELGVAEAGCVAAAAAGVPAAGVLAGVVVVVELPHAATPNPSPAITISLMISFML